MAFHEVRFAVDVSFGALGGPERRVEIVELANGYEERNTPWAASRRRYDAGMGLRSLDDLERLIAFFEARRGQLHAFRWRDWADWRSAPASQAISAFDQGIGIGDGVTVSFQLVKHYVSGTQSETRVIAKPVAGTVLAAVHGVPVAGEDALSVDATTGVVTFAVPPAPGSEVTAGFEFDVPVRFDTDRLQVSVATFEAGEVPAVPLVEVRL
ncbi:DUF2460 domain-containing protein [Frigidibacter sp. MR17.14]|uniref:DUF2460 domain-containing protein n=1 Tax=Frigidibacter sp. MR17.14 TaxID=3126509 RepID=UPI003012FAC8